MSDIDRIEELARIMRAPKSSDQEKLKAADDLLDMCDPDRVAELAQLETFDALEGMKELARSAKDTEVRRRATQAVEDAELARLAHMQRAADE